MARVVIVDDNLMIRRLLREILQGGGHEVVGEAAGGVEAETCVRTLRPDLVLLDLVMPRRGGLEALPRLFEADGDLTVIICSAALDRSRVTAALQLGAAGFIPKPFDRDSVLANVTAALDRVQPMRVASDGAAGDPPAATGPERREFRRVSIAVPVTVKPAGAQPLVTTTVDVSSSGVLLSSGELAVGTKVVFRVHLSPQTTIDGRGRVARLDGDGRPALAFEEISMTDHERLNAFIQERAEAMGLAASRVA